MNVMSNAQRACATDAALMELAAELAYDSGVISWETKADGSMSMASFLNQCAEAGVGAGRYRGADGSVDTKAMCEAYAKTDPRFQILYTAYSQGADNPNFPDASKVEILDINGYNGAVTTRSIGENGESVYTVAFCGTRAQAAEWNTNADGMMGESSIPQRDASQYFDIMAEKYMLNDPDAKVIVIGHSNGGNKAMYVGLDSENRGLIDQVVALDGQGMSDKGLERLQQNDDFTSQKDKIMLICGENDYVSRLNQFVPKDQQYFVSSRHSAADEGFGEAFMNDHKVEHMFQNSGDTFLPVLASETDQGALSAFTERLYAELEQKLSPAEYAHMCRVVMGLMQGDESVTYDDILMLIGYAGETAVDVLYDTPEGQALWEYLPQTLLDGEKLSGTDGAVYLFSLWALSIPEDSPSLQVINAALKILGFDGIPNLDQILSKHLELARKIATYRDKLDSFLYSNFGIGDSPNTRSPSSYAAEYEEIDVDTARLRAMTEDLWTVFNKLNRAYIKTHAAYNALYAHCSVFGQIAGQLGEMLTFRAGTAKKAFDSMDDAREYVRAINDAVGQIADHLERAELAAKSYGDLGAPTQGGGA